MLQVETLHKEFNISKSLMNIDLDNLDFTYINTLEKEINKDLVTDSLYEFLKYFWDSIVEDDFIDNWHIPYICSVLEKVYYQVINEEPREDVIINVPPGSTKSKIASIMFPIWCWVKSPYLNIITASYSMDLSLELADLSRDVINSPKFQEIFPHLVIRQDHDTKSKYQICTMENGVVKPGGKRLATSVGARVTGFHGHIIIEDDPLDPKSAESSNPEVRKSANNWNDRTLSTRKVNKKVTPTVYIMQRLHQDDPTGHRLEQKKLRVKHICLPGIIRNESEVIPKELAENYINNLLDPTRLNAKVLEELEEQLGPFGYAGQIKQKPVPMSGGLFKIDKLRILTNIIGSTFFKQGCWYWDKAGTANAGCYTVGLLMYELKLNAITQFGFRYLIAKIVRGRWESQIRENIIKQEALMTGVTIPIYIEQEPGSGGKESVQNTIRNLVGLVTVADRPTGDKTTRAVPFSVQLNNGNVAIVNGPWLTPYLNELEFFPNSTYRDQGDASSGAFNKLVAVKGVGGWKIDV